VRVQAASVTSGFFETLGVAPRLGTSDIPGAVVSEQLWRERLHSAADLSKCYITLFRTRYPVIGVMPKGFDFPSGVQVWQLGMARFPVGRLRPGISIGQAQAYLKTLANQFADQRDMAAGGPVVESLHDALLGDRRPLLWMLFGISALFLALPAPEPPICCWREARSAPRRCFFEPCSARRAPGWFTSFWRRRCCFPRPGAWQAWGFRHWRATG
jgi:putative ABC transport system permease protein